MELTFNGSVICIALIISFILFVASCTKGGKRRACASVHFVYGPIWFTELCNSVAFQRISPWPERCSSYILVPLQCVLKFVAFMPAFNFRQKRYLDDKKETFGCDSRQC